ncbi:MAG: hypothetical protein R2932_17180 [Caldilineaceae bacterium]
MYSKVGRPDWRHVHYGNEALTTFTDLGQRQYAAILEAGLGTLELMAVEQQREIARGDGDNAINDVPCQHLAMAQAHFCRSRSLPTLSTLI